MKHRANKAKAGGKPGKPPVRPPRAAPPAPLSPGRKWLFRLAALVILPLLLLGGLEVGLRLAGYGHATGFFEKIRVGGRAYLVNNESFSLRFFPPQLARTPEPLMLEAEKPADTYRIFILGESAARGEPEPAYAASRYLETLLDARYPGTHFEVVNTGITAIDSHVILPIARDCAKAGGNLWIIYMGNNEMVGPFGAATVFGTKAPPLEMVRLDLAIQKTRIGQLLAAISRRLKGKGPNESWGGMNMFVGNQLRADDPRKAVVYENFARNLDDIIQVGLASGAKILLNTVAVNLKDCPPFASLTNASLSADERAQFDRWMSEASADETTSNYAGAAQSYEQAAQVDPLYPKLHYRWAECLLALTNDAGAREQFQLACDDDALPFRADSRINGAIEKAGEKYAGGRLTLLDAATALATNLPADVCGRETFFEHVHFNFDGNFRLGRAWAEAVAPMLPAAIADAAVTNGWISQAACDRRLVTERMIERLQHPPLSDQPNNAERIQLLRDEVNELRQRMNLATARSAVEIYESAINRTPQDPVLHENFAEFLGTIGDFKKAESQWQQVQEMMPYNWEPFYRAGFLLVKLNQWDEAEAAFKKVLTLCPGLAEGWCNLGAAYLGAGKFDLALQAYNRARQLEPQNAGYYADAGMALSKMNRHGEALQNYRAAVKLEPDLWEAHLALGDELVVANQITEAEDEFSEVIRLQPDNSHAHLNLGVLLAKQGQLDEAQREFEATLRLEPGNGNAQEYLARVLEMKKHAP